MQGTKTKTKFKCKPINKPFNLHTIQLKEESQCVVVWKMKFVLKTVNTGVNTGSGFGNKNSLAKKSEHSEENCLLQAKIFFSFVKRFSEFAREFMKHGITIFHLALIIVAVVFLIVQFILFLCFGGNNQ